MKTTATLLGLMLVVLLTGLPCYAQDAGDEPVMEAASSDLANPNVTIGAQHTENEFLGYGDVLVPLFAVPSGLLFINPRISANDNGDEEANLGLGIRWLSDDKKFILGLNAYWDHREFDNGIDYNQGGFGAELLTRNVDARFNYYVPEKDTYVLDSFTTRDESVAYNTYNAYSTPYATGNQILQNYEVRQTKVTTTTISTFEQYLAALEGYDWEVGLRLPLPENKVNDYVKVFGGYYDFSGRFDQADVDGFKARMEARFFTSLFLDAGWYDEDNLTGEDWYVGLRYQAPFDLAALSEGKNPFARTEEDAEMADPMTARMNEMVMRDMDVRVTTSDYLLNENLSSQETNYATRVLETGDEVVLMDDVTFVGPLSGGGLSGIAEDPKTNIQQGVDAAYGEKNVFVFAQPTPYFENVVLAEGVNLYGGGCEIIGPNGEVYGGDVHATIDGMSMGPTVTMADNSLLSGFRIQNTDSGGAAIPFTTVRGNNFDISRVGVLIDGVSDVTIGCNIIEGNSWGVLGSKQGDFNTTFRNNVVQNNSGDGVRLDGLGSSGTFWSLMEDNKFNANGSDGMEIFASNYDDAYVFAHNNEFNSNVDDGLNLQLSTAYGVFADVSGGTANNNGEDGIDLELDSDTIALGLIGKNQAMLDWIAGLLTTLGVDTSSIPAEFQPLLTGGGAVTASSNADDGIKYSADADTLALAAVFDAVANSNGKDGIDMDAHSANGVAVTLAASSQNLSEIMQLAINAIPILESFLGPIGVAIPDMPAITTGYIQAKNNTDTGLKMDTYGRIAAIAMALGVDASNNGAVGEDGIEVDLESDTVSAFIGARLLANDNGKDGVDVHAEAGDVAVSLLADVQANNNASNGLAVYDNASNGYAANALLGTDMLRDIVTSLETAMSTNIIDIPGSAFGPNQFNNNGGNGVDVEVGGDDLGLNVMLDAELKGNGEDGLRSTVEAKHLVINGLLDLRADGNAGYGIHLNSDSETGAVYTVAGSTATMYEQLPGLVERVDTNSSLPTLPPITLPETFSASRNGKGGLYVETQTANDENVLAVLGGDFSDNSTGNMGTGRGISALQESGDNDVITLLGFVTANRNENGGVYLDSSAYGDNTAILYDVTASENGEAGVALDMEAQRDDVAVLASKVVVNENGNRGFSLNAEATNDDVYVLMGDMQANGNSGVNGWGVDAHLTAAEDVAMGLVGVTADDNSRDGAQVDITAEGDVTLLALGDSTLLDTNALAAFDFFGNNLDDVVFFTNTTSSFSGNAEKGLRVHIDMTDQIGSGDDIAVLFDGVTASDNGEKGLSLYANNENGMTTIGLANSVMSGNGSGGAKLEAVTDNAAINAVIAGNVAQSNGDNGVNVLLTSGTGDISVVASNNVASYNTKSGLKLDLDGGNVNVLGYRNVLANNTGNGLRMNATVSTLATLNFGNVATPYTGYNSMYGNGNRDARNNGVDLLMLEQNYWGVPVPVAGQFSGNVDYDPALAVDPN